MKFVIVYDSVSKTRVTEKVAVMIQDALKEKGIEAEALQVNHASGVRIEDFDCLIVGSPTMGWRPTKETMNFLDGLKGKVSANQCAASFDTQMKVFISGNANKAMEPEAHRDRLQDRPAAAAGLCARREGQLPAEGRRTGEGQGVGQGHSGRGLKKVVCGHLTAPEFVRSTRSGSMPLPKRTGPSRRRQGQGIRRSSASFGRCS